MKIKDRPEFRSKPKPLTFPPEETVATAVYAMTERNYGSVVIVDPENRPLGMVTERDIMTRLVNKGLDAKATELRSIMTTDVRVAKADDELVDWLRIMSNERFRRLPVVDDDGRVVSIMTQGDFVSYTWPDLVYQATQLGRATISSNFQTVMILAAILLYVLVVISFLTSSGML